MSLLGMLRPHGPSGFGYGSSAEQVTRGLDLTGRTVLVTGVNSGLGQETARVLALRGAHVWAAARSVEKAAAATRGLPGTFTPVACELGDPASVRACAATVGAAGPLHAILANAGIMALAERTLVHGYEAQFFTNHIGHFLLVTSLLGALTDDARVILTSSAAHDAAPKGGIDFDNLDAAKGYVPWQAYGQSKIANILFAVELARRFQGTKRTANAVHPGVIRTNLARNMGAIAAIADVVLAVTGPFVLKSVGEGAATQTWAAVHPDAAQISGEYLADCNVASPRADARDPAIAARLWARSEEIVAAL